METPDLEGRKILSSYQDISRTFTYGAYATLPLFVIYQITTYIIGIPIIKNGVKYQMISDAEYFLRQALTLFGTLPEATAPFLFVASMMALLLCERKKLGFIQVRIPFFCRTLCESAYFGFIIGYVSLLLTGLMIFLLSGTFPPVILSSVSEPFLVILQKTGFGFYEEILFRVILLSGMLAFFQIVRIPKMLARIIGVTVSCIIFSAAHFFGPFGYHYDIESFLFLSYLGVSLSWIYLRRGFATAAWSHTLYDIFLAVF